MPSKPGRNDRMAGSLKLPFMNLGKSSANVFWKRAIDCYTDHAVSRMSEPLEKWFRFTHALEGGGVAGLHVDRSDFPRVITNRVPESAMAMLHTSLLDVREEAGWGFQSLLSFAITLAAWFSPKALSASSGLPNPAQIALSLSWYQITRLL